MRLAVVIVIDDECAEEEGRVEGQKGNYVAILFAVGDGEEAEGFLVRGVEEERLGDYGGGAAAEEAVGEPRGVEGVARVGGAATVDAVGET